MNTNDQLLVGRELLERIAKTCMFTLANEDYSAVCELLAAQPGAVEPVAEIVNAHGDPEAFAERELKALVDIQKLPIGTKLFAHPPRDVAAEEPLLCDYCGAVTDDPWHSSSAESKHLHQCDTCHAKAAGGVVLPERIKQGIHKSHELDEASRKGWNAYADEYARLNGLMNDD